MHGSVMGKLGKPQEYFPRVFCGNYAEMLVRAVSYVGEVAKEKPVIVFGMDWSDDTRFGLGDSVRVQKVSTVDEMMDLQDKATDIFRAVISLPVEYGIGIDLRFKQDAHVVICDQRLPDSELAK